jgi:hypothetical protein
MHRVIFEQHCTVEKEASPTGHCKIVLDFVSEHAIQQAIPLLVSSHRQKAHTAVVLQLYLYVLCTFTEYSAEKICRCDFLQ